MSDTILVTKHQTETGEWHEITLNRPDRLNSFNVDMHVALNAALTQAASDKNVRAILLTGAGRGFCAGQDLGDRDPSKMDGPPNLGETLEKYYGPNITLIREMKKPVICAVNGVAAGAGANIAFACDITFADKSAKFIQSFANVGLIPDAGGTWTLANVLGAQRAKALAMSAMPLMAEQAADWGLIWQATDSVMDDARAFTEKLANGAGFGLALTKDAIDKSATNSFAEQLLLEQEYQKLCGESKDYAEGVTAFLNKRKPVFRGE
ncbi:MAG: enoyl-CoA hydratase [Halocynthiibacter sp.]